MSWKRHLPVILGEKPALLVSKYREGIKTPSTAQNGHEQVMLTKIRINENGSATGSLDLKLKGLPGISDDGAGNRQVTV